MREMSGPHAATNWSGAAVQGEPAGVNHNSNGACIYRLPWHEVQRVILPLQHHLKADIWQASLSPALTQPPTTSSTVSAMGHTPVVPLEFRNTNVQFPAHLTTIQWIMRSARHGLQALARVNRPETCSTGMPSEEINT